MIICKSYIKAGKIKDKKIMYLLTAVQVIGVLIALADRVENVWNFDGNILRPPSGDGAENIEYEVKTDGYNGTVNIEVEDKKYTDEQIEVLFDRAIDEINETVQGDNSSLDCVTEPLDISQKYCGGSVSAAWRFDDKSVSGDGSIDLREIDMPRIVTAEVLLECEKEERIHTFELRVVPAYVQSKTGIEAYMYRYLHEREDDVSIKLPEKMGESAIKWSGKYGKDGAMLCLIGLGIVFAMPYAGRIAKRQEEERERQECDREYPEIVGRLSLLLGAGLSINDAIGRMAMRYEAEGKLCHGKGLIIQMNRELHDGVSIISSIEDFGRNSGSRQYKRLALLLQQNCRRGNEHLTDSLEKEGQLAFELKKNTAKRLGEEAGTRLLFPMMGMLIIVLIILIYPALTQLDGL